MNLTKPTVDLLRARREQLVNGPNGIVDMERAVLDMRARVAEMEDDLLHMRADVAAIDLDLSRHADLVVVP